MSVKKTEHNGQFKPGNKMGKGRPKGATNKVSREVKARIADFISNNMDGMQEWFDDLKGGSQKLFYLKEFMPYVIPKMKEISEGDPVEKMTTEEKREYLKQRLEAIADKS